MPKIAVVGCKHTTRDLIASLHPSIPISHVITISPKKGKEQKVAGYFDLRQFLDERAIPHTLGRKYSLKSDRDRETIEALEFDLVLVAGWQRLLPDWFLNSLSIGAFGMHGSSKPLPHGRGRSPLNWSLIQNKDIFFTHLFQYLPGIDDGPIVAVQQFDITPFDDCNTLHYKNISSMINLCRMHVPSLLSGTAKLTPQSTEGATYYPKRTEEDGVIFWEDTTMEIYNLIRAVTHPFPGAFSHFSDNGHKVMIWKAQPFDTQLEYPRTLPGEIVQVFYDGSFVIATGSDTLLVTDADYKAIDSDVGRILLSKGHTRKEWDLPE